MKILRPTHPWTKTNMAPLRGWAPLGQRIKAKVPHGRKRSTDAVYNAIAPILDTVTSAECANYFANAGYDQM